MRESIDSGSRASLPNDTRFRSSHATHRPEAASPEHVGTQEQQAQRAAREERARFVRITQESSAEQPIVESAEATSMARNEAIAAYLSFRAQETATQSRSRDTHHAAPWEELHTLRTNELTLQQALDEAEHRTPQLRNSSEGEQEHEALTTALHTIRQAIEATRPQSSLARSSDSPTLEKMPTAPLRARVAADPTSTITSLREKHDELTDRVETLLHNRSATKEERREALDQLKKQEELLKKELLAVQLSDRVDPNHSDHAADIADSLHMLEDAVRLLKQDNPTSIARLSSRIRRPSSLEKGPPASAYIDVRDPDHIPEESGVFKRVQRALGELVGVTEPRVSSAHKLKPSVPDPEETSFQESQQKSAEIKSIIATAEAQGIQNAERIFNVLRIHIFKESISFHPEEYVHQLTIAQNKGRRSEEVKQLEEMNNELREHGLDPSEIIPVTSKKRSVKKQVR